VPRLRLVALRFEGNTVFSDAQLQEAGASSIGRDLGALELEELRQRVTLRYVDAGYINSGAVIPDQDVSDGVLTLRIVEGRLTDIRIDGEHRFRPDYLSSRLALGAGRVLNVNRLQTQMQLMLQDPQLRAMAGQLAPGVVPGEATLRVEVTGGPLFVAGAGVSNERSPAVGSNQRDGFIGWRNLFGVGEAVTFSGAATDGVEDYSVSAQVPLNAGGTSLQARMSRTRSRIVEAPLDELDIAARSEAFEGGLVQPLVNTLARTVSASAMLTNRRTRNRFLDAPSTFIPDAPDGIVTVSALRLGVDWVERTAQRVVAARALVSLGIDAFGATSSTPGNPQSRFHALLLQSQWIERVRGGAGSVVARLETQQANAILPGQERYALGGASSVRGYRKEVLIRDAGWFGSLEYRHALGRAPIPGFGQSPQDGALLLSLFVDAGEARARHVSGDATTFLSSVGAGLRWDPTAGVSLQLYKGFALHPVNTPSNTLADRGWHFRLAWASAF
ncbi:MAG: ShlB/FhaC/HecB family hemolysin secretion/activation protein, partial [Proteobacteria bacterium]|nr:ShlB/FhaC/HecB family hemolysin secretion/activation protein [Burkholderiales bacterium]